MDEDDIWLQYGIPKPGTNTTTPTTPAVAGVAGVRAPAAPPVQPQAAPQQESDDLWAQYGIARPSVVPETPDIPAAAPVSVMDRLAHVGQRLNEARLKLFEHKVQRAQGMLEPGNIDLAKRPLVRNPDGSVSTVRSISVGIDGKEYLIPTVTPDGRVVSDDEAVAMFQQSGQHLGAFDSPASATAYAQKLHQQQAAQYGIEPNPVVEQGAALNARTGGAPAPQMGAPAQMSRPMAADATAVAQPAARPHAELRPGLPAPLAKQATDKAAAEKPASLHEEAIKAIPSLIGAGWSAAAIASLPEAAGVTATTAAAVLPFIAADVASGTDLKQAITRNLAFVIGPEAAIGVAGRMLDLPAANPDMFKIPAQEAAPVKPAEFATHGPLADVKPKVEPKLAIGKPEPAPRTPPKTTQVPRGKIAGLDEFGQVPRFDATHRVGEATATTDVALPPHVPTVPLEEAIRAAEPGAGAAGGAYRPQFSEPAKVEIPAQPELDVAGNMKPVGPTLGQTINQDLKGDLTLGPGLENPEPQGPAAPPTPDLKVRDFEGRVGDPGHLTSKETGTIPTSALADLAGVKGEVRGEHRNRLGPRWDAFKEDIADRGIQEPIFVTVDRDGVPKISEGNHRLDAAMELGLKEVPVEIRYFGHAEEQGRVAERAAVPPKRPTVPWEKASQAERDEYLNSLEGNRNPPKQYTDPVSRALPGEVTEVQPTVRRVATDISPEAPGAHVDSPRPESIESLLKNPRAGFLAITPADIGEAAGRVGKKYLAVAGDLPKPVFDRKVVMDARVSGEAVETEFAVRDFHSAMQKAYGIAGSLQPNQKELTAIDDVLRGDAHVSSLPPVLRDPVAAMRAHLDRLQQRFLDEGVVEGELQAKITDSLGTYLTRAYRVHMDPDWALKVPADVRNRFKSWIDQEYPTLSQEERDGKFNQYLFAGKDGPIAILAGNGKLGAKDLSILTRRGDIPDELRALWGEYAGDKADPLVNYTLSVAKMANLLEHHAFLRDVRKDGIGKFLFEKPTVTDGVSYHTPIAAKGSDTMNPLNGLHTSPEIAQAFVDALDRPAPHGKIWGTVMKINAIAKANKTVLSPMTQVRNVIGNTFFVVANGHWRLNNVNDAIKALGAGTGLSDDAAWRALYLKLTKAGLVGQSYAEAELRTALQQSGNLGFESLTESLAKRAVRKGIDVAQTAYRAGDDVFKVYAAGNEVARYRAAYPKWTDEQLLDNAVKIVQRTYPSEAMTPRFIKAIRRTPLLGTFPSYPYQVIRSTVGVLRQAAEELANPATRAIGASRISGLTAATTFTTGMAAYSRATLGIDTNTDRDVRMFLPPWSQNSSLVYLSRQNGKLEYVDASYTDPSTYITDPIMAFMRGRDWEQKFRDSAVEIFSPFLGEGMLAEKVFDIKRNTKKTGGQVWNPEAPLEDQLVDIMEHVSGAIEPGVLSSAERIYKGVQNDQPIYGPQYDPKTEIIANATGVRRVPLDLPTAVSFRMREFRGQTTNANNILSTVAGRGGKVTDDELKNAYQESERSRRQIFDRMHEMTQAALKLGTPEPTVLNLLSAYGESKKDARNIMDGKYVPRKVTKEFLAGISDALEARSVSPADKATVRAEFKRRRTVLQGLAKESVSP